MILVLEPNTQPESLDYRMLTGQLDVSVSHPLLLASLMIASGNALIMLVLYVFSAYLGRMYLEVKGRPPYVIMERIDGPTIGSL